MDNCNDITQRISQLETELLKAGVQRADWDTIEEQSKGVKAALKQAQRTCAGNMSALPNLRRTYNCILQMLISQYPKHASWIEQQSL